MSKPKISIITPSYNQGQFIEDTILSVLNQNYGNFEHIVVDGGSADNTLDVLKKYSHLKWISEKDNGQSHAINKGFNMASGDIVAWINSDDFYYPNVFLKIANKFYSEPNCNFLYGNITYITPDKNFITNIVGDTISYESLLKNPDLIRQPSSFWSMKALRETGFIDEKIHLVMDLDFILRMLKKYKAFYLPEFISYFRYYDENKTLNNKRLQVKEIYNCLYKYSDHISMKTHLKLLKRYIRSFI